MLELNKIHCGDCLNMVDELEDNILDLCIIDGPYGLFMDQWELQIGSIQEYNLNLIKKFSRVLKPGGSLYMFGKPNMIDGIKWEPYLKLNSRIVWKISARLSQARKNYTNNYNLICYFTKGEAKAFNLDAIRVPHEISEKKKKINESSPSVLSGEYGGTKYHPNGKNPGDIWDDIKALSYQSKELINETGLKTIQKPEKLIERIIKANSSENDLVLDPFCGSGTIPICCKRLNRNFIGMEMNEKYIEIANRRIEKTS